MKPGTSFLAVSPSGLFIFCALWGLLSIASAASAQNNGQIAVTVVNRTTGAALAGQTVALARHQAEGQAAQPVAEGVTAPTGRYVFTGLPADGAHYVVETRYLNIPYMTGHIDLNPEATQHDVQLAVFETTEEDGDIMLNALHLVIDVQPAVLSVTEILVFRNNGTRAFAQPADVGPGLKLTLPAGAFQLQPMSEGLERTDQGLRYTPTIPPGEAQVVYAYSVDRATIGDRLTKQTDYPAGRVQALISPSDQQVEGVNLTSEGVRQIGDKTYLLLSNPSGLQRGMSIGLTFPAAMTMQDMMKWAMVGLVALMVISGVIVGLKPTPASEPQQTAPTILRQLTADEERQYAALLQEVADLDDQHDAGTIGEKAYRQRRNGLKNRAFRLRIDERGDE